MPSTTARTIVVTALLLSLLAVPLESASQQPAGIAIAIEKHALLRRDGVVVLRMRVVCGPLAGTEEFQEGFAGGSQARTGAESEGGIDGPAVCDGVEREYTAQLSSYTEAAFRNGPARFSAAIIVCMLVGDEQQCYQGAAGRRVILRGGSG